MKVKLVKESLRHPLDGILKDDGVNVFMQSPKRRGVNRALLEKMETDTITVKVRKGTGENLKEILEFIAANGNGGHSFGIDIDWDERFPEEGKQFYWDGDGSDYIESVKLN